MQGILRRTSLASYRTATPEWETVLDVDALARGRGQTGSIRACNACRPKSGAASSPSPTAAATPIMCASSTCRTKQFVEGGFSLPEGKQNVTWVDADTILVAREWGPGTMTQSGYPFVIKRLRRGQTLDQAEEVFRGQASDVRAAPMVLRDPEGRVHGIGAYRGVDFFHSQTVLFRARRQCDAADPAARQPRRDRRRAAAGDHRRGLGCRAGDAFRDRSPSSPTISPNGSGIR